MAVQNICNSSFSRSDTLFRNAKMLGIYMMHIRYIKAMIIHKTRTLDRGMNYKIYKEFKKLDIKKNK